MRMSFFKNSEIIAQAYHSLTGKRDAINNIEMQLRTEKQALVHQVCAPALIHTAHQMFGRCKHRMFHNVVL